MSLLSMFKLSHVHSPIECFHVTSYTHETPSVDERGHPLLYTGKVDSLVYLSEHNTSKNLDQREQHEKVQQIASSLIGHRCCHVVLEAVRVIDITTCSSYFYKIIFIIFIMSSCYWHIQRQQTQRRIDPKELCLKPSNSLYHWGLQRRVKVNV